MTDLIVRHIIPAAYRILPPEMASQEATALLVAIGLQESRFEYRAQMHGPARGFWQFEIGGVEGVLAHDHTGGSIRTALRALRYDPTTPAERLQVLLEHNDVLAACFARCLLWCDPRRSPLVTEPSYGWQLYIDCWRPGKPRPETWRDYFAVAWNEVRRPTLQREWRA
jgi:hypothetical protein